MITIDTETIHFEFIHFNYGIPSHYKQLIKHWIYAYFLKNIVKEDAITKAMKFEIRGTEFWKLL